ncbi:DgyrCDS11532 [Dimorphilus gyrociliatus]|uniref:DgyrCDS11532 n=1 Tax=Dimorphilus gyrociliatus TaxID=2664684 RepID=A0A7I8W3M3_9ANNE|nr:DgyrCDS11532 [Dimorphilus gyrociliatus]
MSSHWTPIEADLADKLRDFKLSQIGENTKAICTKPKLKSVVKPVVPAICHSSTFEIESVEDYLKILKEDGYIYSRLGNPTCQAVEATVSALEEAYGSLTFNTGMAAISSILISILKSGDHVICQNPVYSGTYKFLSTYLSRLNVTTTYIPAGSPIEVWAAEIKPETKVLYGETPCNPDMAVLDLKRFGELGKKHQIITIIDSTFASPTITKPLNYGIDIVVHSATKYMGGHSDLMGGVAATNSQALWSELQITRSELGSNLSPHEAALLLRGLKTLPIRMKRHSDNALSIARYLESRKDKISRVFYPGLQSHPGHEIAKQQMKDGYGGMVSFEMKNGLEGARAMVESLKVINLGVSLGGVDSLISHPASMTHGPMIMDDEERKKARITSGLIRLSVGLEDEEDLLEDLRMALEKV